MKNVFNFPREGSECSDVLRLSSGSDVRLARNQDLNGLLDGVCLKLLDFDAGPRNL